MRRLSSNCTDRRGTVHTGVGEARNRTRKAVERTVPFGLYTQSILII